MSASPEIVSKSLAEVSAYLDELLGVAGAEGSGLLVEGREPVAKVGLAVNCSAQAVEGAIQRGCNLLVTRHGLQPDTDAYLVDIKRRGLLDAGVALYVAGAALDAGREFASAETLARALQVAVQAVLQPEGEIGVGVHGVCSGNLADFCSRVGNRLGTIPRAWRNAEGFGHVAIIPGWGAQPEWMHQAQVLGCDTILTGEALMFGILFAREAGLNLVLAGHYVTKSPGVLALASRLSRDLHLEVTFISEEIVESRS